MADLLYCDSSGAVTIVPLGPATRLGASAENDLCVAVDGVARYHATLLKDDAGFRVEPAEPRLDVRVNGRPIGDGRVTHLDVISLGPADLIFREGPGAGAVRVESPLPPRARLCWADAPRALPVDLRVGETLVGRADSNDVVIDSPAVSRTHARLSFSGTVLTIEDAGSANGTQVNGESIRGIVALRDDDLVSFGRTRTLRVELGGGPMAPIAPPPPAATPVSTGAIERGAEPASGRSDEGTILDLEWQARLVWDSAEIPDAVVVTPAAKAPPVSRAPAAEPARAPAGADDAARTQFGRGPIEAPDIAGVDVSPGTMRARRVEPIVSPAIEPTPAQVRPASAPSAAAARGAAGPFTGVRLVGGDRTIALEPGEHLVGRAAGLAVNLGEHRTVSREHARLVLTPTELSVEDLGGNNGTFVNQQRLVGRRVLVDGDQVAFAEISFIVKLQRDTDPL